MTGQERKALERIAAISDKRSTPEWDQVKDIARAALAVRDSQTQNAIDRGIAGVTTVRPDLRTKREHSELEGKTKAFEALAEQGDVPA